MIRKLYSDRNRETNSSVPQIWEYEKINAKILNQIWLILEEIKIEKIAEKIVPILRKENGWRKLPSPNTTATISSYYWELYYYYKTINDINALLDVIDLICYYGIDIFPNFDSYHYKIIKAIDEINYRLREASIGFKYDINSESILKIADEPIYEYAIKPAFYFLSTPGLEGAKEEFRDAFEDFKTMKFDDAAFQAGKALESTIKTLFRKKEIPFNEEKDSLVKLCETLKSQNILKDAHPEFLSGVICIFKELAKRRNRGGHGKTPDGIPADEAHAKLALNLAATLATFIAETI